MRSRRDVVLTEHARQVHTRAGDLGAPAVAALEFQTDQPHFFQYSYRSDSKTFTATAVGDIDCDGTPSSG